MKRAGDNNPEAWFFLGRCLEIGYFDGNGSGAPKVLFPINLKESIKCYIQGSKQGNHQSMYCLAKLYLKIKNYSTYKNQSELTYKKKALAWLIMLEKTITQNPNLSKDNIYYAKVCYLIGQIFEHISHSRKLSLFAALQYYVKAGLAVYQKTKKTNYSNIYISDLKTKILKEIQKYKDINAIPIPHFDDDEEGKLKKYKKLYNEIKKLNSSETE